MDAWVGGRAGGWVGVCMKRACMYRYVNVDCKVFLSYEIFVHRVLRQQSSFSLSLVFAVPAAQRLEGGTQPFHVWAA